jgi:hypothetical protein
MNLYSSVKKSIINILEFADIAWNNFDIFKTEFDEENQKLYIVGDGTASILIFCLKKNKAIGNVLIILIG